MTAAEEEEDCLEIGFSGLGGWGRLVGNKRNYTANGAIEGLGDLNTMQTYTCLGDDPLRFGSRMRKADVDIRLHEVQARSSSPYTAFPPLHSLPFHRSRGPPRAGPPER